MLEFDPTLWRFFAGVDGATVRASSVLFRGIESLIDGRQILDDGLQLHFGAVDKRTTVKTVPLDRIKLALLTLRLDNQTYRTLFGPLR